MISGFNLIQNNDPIITTVVGFNLNQTVNLFLEVRGEQNQLLSVESTVQGIPELAGVLINTNPYSFFVAQPALITIDINAGNHAPTQLVINHPGAPAVLPLFTVNLTEEYCIVS